MRSWTIGPEEEDVFCPRHALPVGCGRAIDLSLVRRWWRITCCECGASTFGAGSSSWDLFSEVSR